MIKKFWQTPKKRFLSILILSCILSLILYFPFIYQYMTKGDVFSGSGDGFRQMMPFQMYLYEHFASFKGFYDASFGLGGDYVKSLAYYYSMSPLMWINFACIWGLEHTIHINPHDISFWPTNQLVMAYVRTVITLIFTFYLFMYLKFKPAPMFIATILYGMSTVMTYYNFTWSFYGNLLIMLPMSIWAMERFFRERKLGWFIFAITFTLFTNFYFSYYEAVVLGFYLIYRLIAVHPQDIVNRWQKFYILVIATLLSVLSSLFGLYTGVSSFLNNDRSQNPKFGITFLTNLFEKNYNIFTDGFYITISIIVIIALFSFKLYQNYYYKLFAVATWLLLIGSLSQWFDSSFNGFSLPQRRWVYFLALSSGALIALFIQHLSELSLKNYLIIAIPIFLYSCFYITYTDRSVNWMYIAIIIMIVIGLLLYRKSLLKRKWIAIGLVILFLVEQVIMVNDSKKITIEPYQTTMDTINDSSYRSKVLNNKINQMTSDKLDPLKRLDYFSFYALNSPFIYHYNGTSLYSSIFNGQILKYYDKTMQINMPVDKNSTYRYLGNRANLMALWNVQDRLRHPNDLNMPYGFKKKNLIKDGKDQWIHSKNTISYPSAHITHKVYDSNNLKSPLDREQAMLQGVVFDNNTKSVNTTFSPNKNLLNDAQLQLKDSQWKKKNQLKVDKNNGGVQLTLPHSLTKKYKDMYLEMDVELLTPDKEHSIGVNEYSQNRNALSYKYRRVVSPVTMRVKASDKLNIHMSEGTYRFKIKGIYGENYHTLKKASKQLHSVKVKKERNGYTITKNKNDNGYIVLPIAYENGMQARANGKPLDVKKGNGIMTTIPAKAGQTTIRLTYTPPHFYWLIILSIIGVILSIMFTKKVRKNKV
ncbi:YfhO family protein [Staphylococcus capitis]|uniref:YfhO family protein n=1 Tax=Staphylococcus capitis TaxID=29388 RepID=UPI001642E469|nr:YfhO family protein [Staphylococcus capitis]MBC3079616.1 YfhO family protein [Staphylococcus capitis]